MIRTTLHKLETEFERLSRVMSRNYGINVRLEGNRAEFDGKTIRLPANSDYLPESVRALLHGYCDHERLHVEEEVLARNDSKHPSPLEVLNSCTNYTEYLLTDAYEDIRVERKKIDIEPGTVENLAHVRRYLIECIRKKVLACKIDSMLLLLMAAIICAANNEDYSWMPAKIFDWMKKLSDEIRDSFRQKNAHDAKKLALRTIAKIGDELNEELPSSDAKKRTLIEIFSSEIEFKSQQDMHEHKRCRWNPNPEVVARDCWGVPEKGSSAQYLELKQKAMDQIHALRSRLITALKCRSAARWIPDQERGQLDSANLYSLRLGNKRIFKQQILGETTDTAIEILVDESASMGDGNEIDSPAHHARIATVALSESLHILGIPFEVIGFNNYPCQELSVEKLTGGGKYTRWYPFQFNCYKSWSESFAHTKFRMSQITGRQENVDGEALLIVAKRLAIRPETRKIFLVLSDGNPCGGGDAAVMWWHLGHAIKRIADAGIEIYGIGFGEMGATAVKEFYNKENGSANIAIPPGASNQLALKAYNLLKNKLLISD